MSIFWKKKDLKLPTCDKHRRCERFGKGLQIEDIPKIEKYNSISTHVFELDQNKSSFLKIQAQKGNRPRKNFQFSFLKI